MSLRLIEPGKPNQNACIESFSDWPHHECLYGHWFLNLAYARAVIEDWQREYNEEQVKMALGDGRTATATCSLLRVRSGSFQERE